MPAKLQKEDRQVFLFFEIRPTTHDEIVKPFSFSYCLFPCCQP